MPLASTVLYESFVDFYTDPYVTDDANRTPNVICGNQLASQPVVFNQVVDGFLSDIRDATPKTSNFYVASTRQITNENATVYMTGQCVESISQTNCQTCMSSAYDLLKNCFPSTKGTFFNVGCFVRYSDTSFFNVNQTTDITSFLKGHSSKVAIIAAVAAGVIFIILLLSAGLLYQAWKKSKKTDQEHQALEDSSFNFVFGKTITTEGVPVCSTDRARGID
ncbi:hypothetical protein R6Q57_026287 [Mikania cordata]